MKPPRLTFTDIHLDAYVESDLDRFLEIAMDPVSTRFMGNSSGLESEERKLFEKIMALYESSDSRSFHVWGARSQDKLCAHVELKKSRFCRLGELEVVMMVHPSFRRNGIGQCILTGLRDWQSVEGFRMIATLSPDNEASKALIRKAACRSVEALRSENEVLLARW